jgi:hypothetical protein
VGDCIIEAAVAADEVPSGAYNVHPLVSFKSQARKLQLSNTNGHQFSVMCSSYVGQKLQQLGKVQVFFLCLFRGSN